MSEAVSDTLDRSVLVPCTRCGQPAALELVRGVSSCGRCGEPRKFEAGIVWAMLTHLQTVAESEIDAARVSWFDRLAAPLAAFADIFALGLSMSSAFALNETLGERINSPLAGLYIATFGLLGWGALLLLLRRWLGWSKRRPAVVRVACSHCRASYVALCGAPLTCPLCGTSWFVPDSAPVRVQRPGVAMVLSLQLALLAVALAACAIALVAHWCGIFG